MTCPMLSRRRFLKTVTAAGGAALFGSSLPASAHGSVGSYDTRWLPAADCSVDRSATQIAFVKTQDRAAGVARALDMLDLNSVRGKNVLIKPNYNTADPAPGSTHNDVLSSTVKWVNRAGADSITVGDRGWRSAHTTMTRKGVYDMAEELGFAALPFNALPLDEENWIWFRPAASHWEYGFAVARPVVDAESIISLCCLKTHFIGHITLSLKNSVGIVPSSLPVGEQVFSFMDDMHNSGHLRQMVAEINLAYSPDLIVMDGVTAFVDGGPMTGTRANTEIIMVGTDRVAMDVVGVAILRKFGTTPAVSRGRIFEVEQIARAVELGIGVRAVDQIELIADDADSAAYADEINDLLIAQA